MTLVLNLSAQASLSSIPENNQNSNFEFKKDGNIESILANAASNSFPQEKVYLHLDNTSYYYGDNIYFNAYLVNADGNTLPAISNTLYVELLNPGGEVINKKVVKIENGRACGDFIINRVPFYSGFYEIRAYTKYMLNFGIGTIFSRIIPIFEQPKAEGDYTNREMRKYGSGKFEYKRKKPQKFDKLNLKFYPEGGNLVKRLPSQVAFEITDRYGHPINADGKVIGKDGAVLSDFSVSHEGKGIFRYTPSDNNAKAVVEYDGKRHSFDLPDALESGYVMTVDNLSNTDSISISVMRNGNDIRRDTLGIALLSQGLLKNYALFATSFQKPLEVKFDNSVLSPGVAEIVLFDKAGKAISDRMLFKHGYTNVAISATPDKDFYSPYSPVSIEFSLKEDDGKPVTSPFSLSIRDGQDEISWNRNIMTDLLLMSEIKGYVANPEYYFESDDSKHRADLDLLFMVQGWHRYPWENMVKSKRADLRYNPETSGIETAGVVNAYNKKKPKPGVDISAFLLKSNQENEKLATAMDVLKSDSLGRFSFTADVYGDWNLILAAREKGKKKDYLISIDRLFSPEPQPYRYTDLEISTVNDIKTNATKLISQSDSIPEENLSHLLTAIDDSLSTAGVDKNRIEHLDEVVVKAKKYSKDRDIYEARSKSIAYYDVKSGLDDIRDEGKFIGDDIHTFLRDMNINFTPTYASGEEYLLYKGRMPLFVINYNRTYRTKEDYDRYKNIRLEAIKSIYITENPTQMWHYADPMITLFDIDKIYGCAVFIETYPEGKIPVDAGKGVRKTRLQGYSAPAEFYSPDYSMMEPEPDYRRTLYWNPSVKPDDNGKAIVKFHNNSNCKNFTIDLQTVTPSGSIGYTR